jgi:hypothetical protein
MKKENIIKKVKDGAISIGKKAPEAAWKTLLTASLMVPSGAALKVVGVATSMLALGTLVSCGDDGSEEDKITKTATLLTLDNGQKIILKWNGMPKTEESIFNTIEGNLVSRLNGMKLDADSNPGGTNGIWVGSLQASAGNYEIIIDETAMPGQFNKVGFHKTSATSAYLLTNPTGSPIRTALTATLTAMLRSKQMNLAALRNIVRQYGS